MRKNNKNKGFTLVELLIVVAIIGILAAVLTPQFLNARKVAADKAAEAFAHNIYTAVQARIAEDGAFAEITDATLSECGTSGVLKIGDYSVTVPASGLKVTGCLISETGVYVTYTGGDESPAKVGDAPTPPTP